MPYKSPEDRQYYKRLFHAKYKQEFKKYKRRWYELYRYYVIRNANKYYEERRHDENFLKLRNERTKRFLLNHPGYYKFHSKMQKYKDRIKKLNKTESIIG
jgi:hypothetical protein